MSKNMSGQLVASNARFAVVAGRFNHFVVDALVEGAKDAIVRLGGDANKVTTYWAPGAFEIPQVTRRVIQSGSADAVIAVGAVIRGATPHFDYVASAVARGISKLSIESDVPVSFGVLTTDTIEQAIERSGTKAGNKGFEAAMAAIEMLNLFREMDAQ